MRMVKPAHQLGQAAALKDCCRFGVQKLGGERLCRTWSRRRPEPCARFASGAVAVETGQQCMAGEGEAGRVEERCHTVLSSSRTHDTYVIYICDIHM